MIEADDIEDREDDIEDREDVAPDGDLQAPFPWFGGKRKVAGVVWERFGAIENYVEPFFGSGAVLLGRPAPFSGLETVNDLDGYVANFWRAVRAAPDEVAEYADNPVFENDLHARHVWLVGKKDELRARLEGDPEYYDAKVAGWWVWGISSWIGGGFCSGNGPWGVDGEGRLVLLGEAGSAKRKRPHLGNSGKGVNRQRPHLGNAGQGVNRQLPHLGDAGKGVNRNLSLVAWMRALARRLRGVRVCSGDWSRVCGPSVTCKHGITGVFLDPPYSDAAGRDPELYAEESLSVAHDVREWCIENGGNRLLRIALCGYEGEHEMPEGWVKYKWNAGTGYGGQASERTWNGKREVIWFSPHCLSSRQVMLSI